jgi:hypothetical protein
MREAGRALALDPENRQALGTMTRLLVEPPREVPAEVEHILGEAEAASSRLEANGGVWSYLFTLAFAPLLFWMGVRSWWLLLTLGALLAVQSALALWFSKARRVPPSVMYGVVAINGVFVALTSRVFSPYVVAPGIAAIGTVAFVMHSQLKAWIILLIGCLSVAVPIALELTGVLAPTAHFTGSAIVITPAVVSFAKIPTIVTLTLASIGLVLPATLSIDRLRRAQLAAERKMHLQSWQLRQLVPSEVHDVASPTPPELPDCSVASRLA